jgi:glucose/arabinose dehydrogenase/cytochrome c553
MLRKAFIVLAVTVLLAAVGIALLVAYRINNQSEFDPFADLFASECSTCHGTQLQGTPSLGPALINVDLRYGDSIAALQNNIANGFPEKGMPSWRETLSETDIKQLAIYIAERRVDRVFTDFKVDKPLAIPQGTVESEVHNFRIEIVATGIDPKPFSIAPLPDGSILVTEKTKTMRLVSTEGKLSAPIAGLPEAYADEIELYKIAYGLGWLLDVAPHPNYGENGWIYLHYTDRCQDCGLMPKSMNTIIRGRIRDGAWVDQEDIWRLEVTRYSSIPDVAAGGRLTFDDTGYLYFSVGVKCGSNHHGIQDLTTACGKSHRLHDDGGIPNDNPFVDEPGAMGSIWTYGHRSQQGLEFNFESRQLWATEMGPRGGDELNLLLPGKNYGWPLTSKGLNYDGTPVEYGNELGIEFDLADIEQPVVDFTPAPAISSFIFYRGDMFPRWRGHALIGSLKATELYRVVLDDDKLAHSEVVLKNLARIRDIESGPDGAIYLLLEHETGGQIVRLVNDYNSL